MRGGTPEQGCLRGGPDLVVGNAVNIGGRWSLRVALSAEFSDPGNSEARQSSGNDGGQLVRYCAGIGIERSASAIDSRRIIDSHQVCLSYRAAVAADRANTRPSKSFVSHQSSIIFQKSISLTL